MSECDTRLIKIIKKFLNVNALIVISNQWMSFFIKLTVFNSEPICTYIGSYNLDSIFLKYEKKSCVSKTKYRSEFGFKCKHP